MSNAQFKRNFAKLLERAGEKAEAVVRDVALDMHESMVDRSPVDSGRFKGNWQFSLDAINSDANLPEDASGQQAVEKARALAAGFKVGQTIYMTNSLPYAVRLERGWSNQAPTGMVRLTVMEFKDLVARQAAAVK